MKSKKIVFMGTPRFAVPALQKLIESEHEIVAVYTAVPKPAGRGKGLKKSSVHELAESNNIKVFTPQNLKNETLPGCDIAVVAAYALLLPEHILTTPKLGCVNIHPSLLPRWRGAAPIQRSIMAGDEETAVCIMQLNEGMDTGDILLQRKFALDKKITSGELHNKCAEIGAVLALQVVNQIEDITPVKQATIGYTHAQKISKADEKINWANPAEQIERQIRGLNPFPGAYFEYKGERIKIFAADIVERTGKPGELLDEQLLVACGNSSLKLQKLQRPGKRALDAGELLCGFTIPKGTLL